MRSQPAVLLPAAWSAERRITLHSSSASLRPAARSVHSICTCSGPVRRIRLAAVLAGGALCGVAGAYLSVVYTPLWVEGMVAGRREGKHIYYTVADPQALQLLRSLERLFCGPSATRSHSLLSKTRGPRK